MTSLFAGPSRLPQRETVVTYRHLLSPAAMTVFNPLRVIGHCDIDGAFAQFEQVRLGLPDDVPLVCAQWNSIIAVNYPAKAFGIKRMTLLDDAKKLCPELVVQHVATYREGESEAGYWEHVDRRTHKVSLDPYRRESLKILAVFREMAPTAELEKASIDEAFMDLTPMVIARILETHPNLASVPDDAPEGLDTPLPPAPPIDWSKCGHLFPIKRDHVDENGGDDEVEDEEPGWQDVAICYGAEIMAEVRAEVWKRLHYTCSAGIANNKAMAKLCSAWKKPNQQTVLRPSATAGFLRDMEFTEIRMLGGKLGNAIATEFNATTVGDMLSVPLDDLQSKFGEESIWVYNIFRGIDHTEVKEKLANKSMLASKNTIPNVTTPEQGHHWLSVLAGELNVRLREAREVTPGLWPKTLVLSIRGAGWDASRSRQAPFPFTRSLDTGHIVKWARKLWDEMTQGMGKGGMKLNNISISFTGLEKLEQGQRGIEGFFAAGSKDKPAVEKRPLESTTPPDVASPKRPRLGTLHTNPRRNALETFLARGSVKDEPAASSSTATASPPPGPAASVSAEASLAPAAPADVDADVTGAQTDSWTCPKCQTTFTPPDHVPECDGERAAWLAAAKLEHEDYHFALSLQEADGGGGGGRSGSSSSRSRNGGAGGGARRPKPPATGIKAFFAPKK